MYKRSIKPRLAIGEHAIFEKESIAFYKQKGMQVIVSRNSKRLWQINVRNGSYADHRRLFTNKFSNEMTAMLAVHALLGKGYCRVA